VRIHLIPARLAGLVIFGPAVSSLMENLGDSV
jgi:hypothetical protein